jgi:hypothetical protein
MDTKQNCLILHLLVSNVLPLGFKMLEGWRKSTKIFGILADLSVPNTNVEFYQNIARKETSIY